MRNYKTVSRGEIYRSRTGIIFGVCRGLADHFDFPVTWARAIAIIFLLVSGLWPAIGLYLIATFFMKPAPVIPLETKAEQEFYDSYTKFQAPRRPPDKKTI
jgi:phage shock protein C